MTTLRNKRKLAAVTRETQEEHPRNGQSRNTSVPRIDEEYITQVSEEVEGRVTEKLSQEFSRKMAFLRTWFGFLRPHLVCNKNSAPKISITVS